MSPEQIQQIQQILFIASVILGVAGLACLAGAAYVYFKFDVRDIQDDLSGKKRAEAIASMDAPGTGVLRRRASHDKSNRAKARLAAVVDPVESSASLELAIDQQKSAPARQEAKPKPSRPAPKSVAAPIPQIDDDAVTSVLEEEVDQTTMFGNDVAPEQTDEKPAATEDRQHDFVNAAIKTEEKTTESISEESRETSEAAKVAVPDYFKVVQRIVLMGSADFVRVEQGEGHE